MLPEAQRSRRVGVPGPSPRVARRPWRRRGTGRGAYLRSPYHQTFYLEPRVALTRGLRGKARHADAQSASR
jgi:hypothetical protein